LGGRVFLSRPGHRGISVLPRNCITTVEQARGSVDRAIESGRQKLGLSTGRMSNRDPMIKHFDKSRLIQSANAYQSNGEIERARRMLQRINEMFPGDFDLIAQEFLASQHVCNWQRYEYLQRVLRDNLRHKGGLIIGEPILACSLFTAADLLTISQRHVEGFSIRDDAPALARTRRPISSCDKLRVGFLGSDFYNQATTHLMVGLIEEHDRSRFEFIAYDSRSTVDDPMRQRIIEAFDRFRDVGELDNAEIAKTIEADAIDILVFLRNPTDPRVGVLALRPATVQIAYLYNPSGFGAPLVDFLIADSVIAPPELECNYSERIARLPFSYQPNDTQRPLPQACTRGEFGLPADKFVLANLGSAFKITPPVFDVWCNILRQHPECVLWLLQPRGSGVENLRLEASLRGVDPTRIFFAPLEAIGRHITRLSCADLVLDTHPYGGHTGSSDALWAGVPVLTLMGDTFASRVAASLLNAVGLSGLIAQTTDEYVSIASYLIKGRRALAAYRTHLSTRREHLPLFDVCSYARAFEDMLLRVWSE
jgi:protein O-GlcNAc transferase